MTGGRIQLQLIVSGCDAITDAVNGSFRADQLALRLSGVVKGCPTPAHAQTFPVCRRYIGQALDKPQGRKPRELRRERCHRALLFYGDLNSPGSVLREKESVTDRVIRAEVVG